MFENKTYENLLDEKLESINSKYDKREGSIIFDALAPNSFEDANVYATMSWRYQQRHGETADRENLIQLAKDTRGIEPKAATKTILKAEFNCPVEIGTRFSHEDVNYIVTELLEDNTYKIECETPGEIGNEYLGDLIPVEYIPNLETATVTEILVYGADEEDTEVFRQRWRDRFKSTEFAGNKAAYKKEIKDIDGVGGVKVERATNLNGSIIGGHVRCTIISSNFDVPSAELIDEIQTHIDPLVNQGDGDGFAPIGAVVTIQAVKGIKVDVSAEITFDTGYSFELLRENIESAIDGYFGELCKGWEENDMKDLIVRVARVESAILNVEGIIDIKNTALNNVADNLTLNAYSIPLRGDIIG